jgi:hypothetical protein
MLMLCLSGCATILGTVVSPITGGVDMAANDRITSWILPDFLVGALIGPFVAVYNGTALDASVLSDSSHYWRDFKEVFRPFEMLENERKEKQMAK